MQDWSTKDTLEFLEYLRENDGERLKSSLGPIFIENDISGKVLLSLNDKEMQNLGISSFGKRKKLTREIEKLKQFRGIFICLFDRLVVYPFVCSVVR